MVMRDKKTILVIDDENDLVEMLKHYLELEGYRVLMASNGEEGLKVVRETKPHLIILDMNMPKMGGIAFYEAICQNKSKKPICPVLVLTARANLESIFRDLDVAGFMSKPFDLDALSKEVGAILSTQPYAESSANKNSGNKEHKRIVIVEDDEENFSKVISAFASKGYIVMAAKSGTLGIELIKKEQPDLALIKWDLPDLSGDIVASKLGQMPMTMGIPIILYMREFNGPKRDVLNNLCKNAGVKHLVESYDPVALLMECDGVLRFEK
ncbi:MAG: DNA-binding response OmpR family regulator [Candidatus Omnitrophota bacterium]|jgi:DNA-binding response OmpR family regulator